MVTSQTSSGIENVLLPSSAMTPPPPPPPPPTTTKPQDYPTTTNNITVSILPSSSATDTTLVQTLTEIINAAYLETESDIWNPGFQRTTTEEVARLIQRGEVAVAWHHQSENRNNGETTTKKAAAAAATETETATATPVGCVHIQLRDPATAEFGMLALDRSFRGGGTGSKLALFAEEHARNTFFAANVGSTRSNSTMEEDRKRAETRTIPKMQLHLLVPTTFEHKFKMRLREWYTRMGYVQVQAQVQAQGQRDSDGGVEVEVEEVRSSSSSTVAAGGKDVASEFPELAPLLAGPAEFYVFEKKLF